jgi:hypothetical protein
MFVLNKTESITQLYNAIKKNPPRIRCYNWETASTYLMDFMNVYRVPTDREYGPSQFTYHRHGAKADDILHGINYAYTMGRLIMGEPVVEDHAIRLKIAQMLNVRGGIHTGDNAGSAFHGDSSLYDPISG